MPGTIAKKVTTKFREKRHRAQVESARSEYAVDVYAPGAELADEDARQHIEDRRLKYVVALEEMAQAAIHDTALRADILKFLLKISSMGTVKMDIRGKVQHLHALAPLPDLSAMSNEQLSILVGKPLLPSPDAAAIDVTPPAIDDSTDPE